MPFVDIRYTEGSLGDDQLARITDRITQAAIAAEGLADNAISRSISVVTAGRHERLFVGGQPARAPRFLVTIRAFADAMDLAARETLVAEVTAAFASECEACRETGGRTVWCVIEELPAATFAVGGRFVSLDQVRALTAAG